MSSRGLQFKTVNDGATYKSILYINSADRENEFQKPNDFRINLNPTIKNIYAMEVNKVEMIQSVYPVNNNNNIIHWRDQGFVELESVIPVGLYSLDELVSAIELVMNADTLDGQTYTATLDPMTKKLTITATGGLVFTMWADRLKGADSLLGLDVDIISLSAVFPKLMDMSYPRNVSIRSSLVQSFNDDVFHTNSSKQDKLTTILIEVPMDAQFGDLVAYEPQSLLKYSVKSRALDYILFKLQDENEQLIDNNEMDWSISITLYSLI